MTTPRSVANAAGAMTVAAIPAFNEESSIGSVVLLARTHVGRVVVVDDGSKDSTAQVAELAGAVVLRHERNAGKGRALRTIFEWARENGVEQLVLLDADGQHDPDEIPVVLRPIAEGKADLCIGSRFGKNTEMPAWRRVGKRALDYTTAAGGGALTDSQCGFRAFSRKAIETLRLEQAGFAVESEMVIQARRANLRLTEVPITCAYGDLKGSTKGPVAQATDVLSGVTRMIGEKHPLLMLGVPALTAFIAGVYLALRVFEIVQERGRVAIGTAVLASLMILTGLMFALTAIILHVLPGAIAKQLRRQQESILARASG